MAFGYLSPYRRRPTAGGSLFDLHQQVNRLFDDLFDQDGDSGFYARSGMSAPALEVHRDGDRLEITAELPGVREEDVDLTVQDGVLTLRGEKKSSRKNEERGYSERSYGSFERRITLPQDVDTDACSADFSDGVLTITLPINEQKSRGKRIPLGRQQGQSSSENEGQLIDQHDRSGGSQREHARETEST